ncbi:hypothetical protein [Blautia glucerasea]|uniref:hypothetical protein n=1 Tax=Blautia glucerasea TaxID=536633 RepID=UPI00156D639A|nr:hypothetical protein [Blautia glucerasea]NSJ27245.1 hypothetical protein [Blautia glucerasea]
MDRIKSIVIGIFSLIWVSGIWTTAAMGTEEGGAGVNGILAFILWALCIFLIIKGRAVVAVIASTVIMIIISIPKLNTAGVSGGFWEVYTPVAEIIAVIVIIKVIIDTINKY